MTINILTPGLSQRQPWAGISERLRRYGIASSPRCTVQESFWTFINNHFSAATNSFISSSDDTPWSTARKETNVNGLFSWAAA